MVLFLEHHLLRSSVPEGQEQGLSKCPSGLGLSMGPGAGLSIIIDSQVLGSESRLLFLGPISQRATQWSVNGNCRYPHIQLIKSTGTLSQSPWTQGHGHVISQASVQLVLGYGREKSGELVAIPALVAISICSGSFAALLQLGQG